MPASSRSSIVRASGISTRWAHSRSVTLVTAFLEPVAIAPLYNSFEPLAATSPARAPLEALTRRAGVSGAPIVVADSSRRTNAAIADVAGFGPTKRIVLSDNLLANATTGEIVFLTARELGHYAHADDFRLSLFWTALFIVCTALAVVAADRVAFRRDDDPLSRLPLVFAFLGLLALVATPLYNGYSRNLEGRADTYALALTRDPAAALAIVRSHRGRDARAALRVAFHRLVFLQQSATGLAHCEGGGRGGSVPVKERVRCAWARSELSIPYHDLEWGTPVHDDRTLFEFLVLEGAQAGLSWETILAKRERYRVVFKNFDIEKVAKFESADIERLMNDAGIVRNRLKITAAIDNAKAALALRRETGSTLDAFLWSYVGGKPVVSRPKRVGELLATTPVSEQLSKDLRKRGFRFVGPTIMYAFMQAVGMVDGPSRGMFSREASLEELLREIREFERRRIGAFLDVGTHRVAAFGDFVVIVRNV